MLKGSHEYDDGCARQIFLWLFALILCPLHSPFYQPSVGPPSAIFNTATTIHRFLSPLFSSLPSPGSTHSLDLMSVSTSHLRSTSNLALCLAVSKKPATFLFPVCHPATTHTLAPGSADKKCRMLFARASCSPSNQRQSHAIMRVKL